MFKLTSNQNIKISRGDDSGTIELSVNKGTALEPIQYTFANELEVETPSNFTVEVDKNIWREQISESGTYSFYYLRGTWYFNNGMVSLADYGITLDIKSSLKDEDTITIMYHNYVEEIYFYVFQINDNFDNFIIKKTFRTSGEIETIYGSCAPGRTVEKNVVNKDHNIELSFDSIDTRFLPADEYRYVVRAKLYDKDSKSYYKNTIMNQHAFFVIDDDFARDWR